MVVTKIKSYDFKYERINQIISICFAINFMNTNTGNGLMDEKEFRQWIQRIQSLQEESLTPSTSQTETDDDITQDLIAAFRYLPFFYGNLKEKLRAKIPLI